MSPEKADNLLADAIWWLRGFRAAHPVDMMDCDPTQGLGDALLNVRNWLVKLSLGRARIIGANERQVAVVMTEGEFEQLFDGLRVDAAEEDLLLARTKVAAILQEFRHERASAFNPEVPF